MDSDQGKLFVGGISWETTEENLKDHFQKYGEIVETVIMKDRNTGRARGFGFVSFADPAAADMALLDKHTINGRVVEAKKAVPRDEQQNMNRSSVSSGGQSPGGQGRTKKIFVGGLASTVTEEEFKGYFEQFGTISDAVVMYDHTTQRPRGFGFITYDSEDSVDSVLTKTFHELKDKMVEVKRAVPRDQSSPTMKSPVNTYPASPALGRNYGQYPAPGMYGARPDARFGGMPGRGAYPYPGYPNYGGGYVMNGAYPGSYPYGGGAGYNSTYGGGAGGGYNTQGGNNPGYNPPSRNAWPGAGTYGGTQGYTGAGYSTGMWGSGTQNPAQGGGNYGGYYGGGGENGYGGPAYGRGGGYGENYGNSGGSGPGTGTGGGFNQGYDGYGDGHGWGNDGGMGNGGYDMNGGGGAGSEGANGAGAGYGGGYGAPNRQVQRGGGEARFRPYPTASDR